jgi:hypothetical protein
VSSSIDAPDVTERRGRVHWVTVALGVLVGITLLIALLWAIAIAYTWATDRIGA